MFTSIGGTQTHDQACHSTGLKLFKLLRLGDICIFAHLNYRNVILMVILIFTCISSACEDPGQVPNAERTPTSSFNIGTVVTFHCNTGFTITGGTAIASQILCQNHGQWTPIPSCSRVSSSGSLLNFNFVRIM